MTIRAAYPSYKEIRFEIITSGQDSERAEPGSRIPGSQNDPAASAHAWPQLAEGELHMREWHKPTIEETESGMEVTSYLPAELDRA
jgi:coenzyme PQQ precursor peptide PqqA